MKGKELQDLLTGVVTFVVSAKENGVMVSFSYNPNIEMLELYVRDDNGIKEDCLSSIKIDTIKPQLLEFMEMVIDKYYKV